MARLFKPRWRVRIVCSLAMLFAASAAAAAPCPSTIPDPEYVRIGTTMFAVPLQPTSGHNTIVPVDAATPAPSNQSGCKDHPTRADLYGLPLDSLVPETVDPNRLPPPEDPDFRRSISIVFLAALPVSGAAAQHLSSASLDELAANGISLSESPSLDKPPRFRHVVFGPYEHSAWGGHFVVPGKLYTFPDGGAFAFTCDPGEKWGACTVNYVLRPGLGLVYKVQQDQAYAKDDLMAKLIKADLKIRGYALGLIVPTH